MQTDSHHALKTYMKYRELKKKLLTELTHTSEDLEAAEQDLENLVGSKEEAKRLIKKWDDIFDDAEKMFHHQGG